MSETKPIAPPVKAVRVFVNNAPDEWHISDGKWRGVTYAVCLDEATAKKLALAFNCHDELVAALENAADWIASTADEIDDPASADTFAANLSRLAEKAKGEGKEN